jgi:DNA-binding transcriptional ArsR family regulator
MVVDQLPAGERTDLIFHALADPTRRDIVVNTMGQEHSVSALAGRYPMSFAAVQKHVAVLERAGLVSKRRCGREQLVHGNVATVREAFTVLEKLERVWRARVEQFGEVLAEIAPTSATTSTPIQGVIT